MSRDEYERLQAMHGGAQLGLLAAVDLRWLAAALAANPAYFDELPRRGVIAPEGAGGGLGDGFRPGLDAASAQDLKILFDAATRSSNKKPE